MTALPDAATWRAWGIDPEWSRLLDVPGHDGVTRRWHVLDTGPVVAGDRPTATIVCVHGNPTWAYAWKSFLTRFAGRHRVVAIDQLGMGYSERTELRRYATRVRDLGDVIGALELDPAAPLVVAAHDWGGAIAMGWAVDHVDRLAGLVLCNTGIAVPAGRAAPSVIRLAASAPLRDLVCRRTPTFVEGTVRLSGRRIDATDRAAFRAPYRRAGDRSAIADFVGDIPLRSPHPSERALAEVADRLAEVDVPVMLAWGAADPVFDDDFAHDLAARFPHAVVQRFAGVNHLVMAEADVAGTVETWLGDLLAPDDAVDDRDEQRADALHRHRSLWAGVHERRGDHSLAVRDMAGGSEVGFDELATTIDAIAAELVRRGLQPGDRVAMVTPPGVDLIAAVYGVWRAGGVTVIADRGLGLRGLGAALRSARPAWVVGPRAARAVSRVMRWAPGATSVDVGDLLGSSTASGSVPVEPEPRDPAAILFTSGATGPAKGVCYTHAQLAAQRDALATTYGIGPDDRLVAAFAPFALYGPALGIASVLPDVDVTEPGTLTAGALEAACAASGATMVFASPAALVNVVDTAETRHDGLAAVRVVMSAGAPVPSETLRAFGELAPTATLHTPYGMTEALPVADIDLVGIDAAANDHGAAGVCVGAPVAGCEVRIARLDFDALGGVPEALDAGATGEILVRAPWVSAGYLERWATERNARPGAGWHRTGDVGHLDGEGRLWVEGRAVHVIDAVDGPITSVPVERAVERAGIDGIRPGRVAAVGVGPPGTQQLVVVVESDASTAGLAPPTLAGAVRAAAGHPVAAVLTLRSLPVDIRHNAKIDRTALASWASTVLAGGHARPSRLRR